MMGRSIYTEEIAGRICERLSEGESLREICRDEAMPHFNTVYEWCDTKSGAYRVGLDVRIAQARARGFDAIAAECLRIADDATNDYMERRRSEEDAPTTAFDAEHVQRSKLRIETRLKLLAKWDPKRYGDKLELAGSQESPLTVVIKRLSDA